jgi:peptidoglycan/xylan/chitin deacetylase (PgdA/CDA1 family)
MIKAFFLFSLMYFLPGKKIFSQNKNGLESNTIISYGGIIRGDTTIKKIALVFTGDEFADGGNYIATVLKQQNTYGSFFLTGNFYRNPKLKSIIKRLKKNGNYLGSHSDKHLLYCDWQKRDSLLVTHQEFSEDLQNAYEELNKWGIDKNEAHYFLPPYEWYTDSIAAWTKEMGLQLVNFSPGTRSNADYTYPEMGSKYVSSDIIMKSILEYEERSISGLNGFILLVHIGTDPRRTDKFYKYLPELITQLKSRGYQFERIDELLN